jgi:hypothetical protein
MAKEAVVFARHEQLLGRKGWDILKIGLVALVFTDNEWLQLGPVPSRELKSNTP